MAEEAYFEGEGIDSGESITHSVTGDDDFKITIDDDGNESLDDDDDDNDGKENDGDDGDDGSNNDNDSNDDSNDDDENEENDDENSSNSIFLNVAQKLGVEGDDEFNKELQELDSMDDPSEAIYNFTEKVLSNVTSIYSKSLSEKHPVLNNVVEFLENGGNIENFINNKAINDYSSYNFKQTDVDDNSNKIREEAIREEARIKGVSEEDIEDIIDVYKVKNKLHEKFEKAKNFLKEHKEQTEKEMLQEAEKTAKAQREANVKHWTNVKEIIDSGKIDNMIIPKSMRDELFNYMAKDVDGNGNSQFHKDISDPKNAIKLSLLLKKGFNVDTIKTENKQSDFAEKWKKSSKNKNARSSKDSGNGDDNYGIISPDELNGVTFT